MTRANTITGVNNMTLVNTINVFFGHTLLEGSNSRNAVMFSRS